MAREEGRYGLSSLIFVGAIALGVRLWVRTLVVVILRLLWFGHFRFVRSNRCLFRYSSLRHATQDRSGSGSSLLSPPLSASHPYGPSHSGQGGRDCTD